jgi:hypothetical protein
MLVILGMGEDQIGEQSRQVQDPFPKIEKLKELEVRLKR